MSSCSTRRRATAMPAAGPSGSNGWRSCWLDRQRGASKMRTVMCCCTSENLEVPGSMLRIAPQRRKALIREVHMQPHKIVSQQEWIEARKALLAREKEFTRARDRLNEERRALPWVRVDKAYLFQGPA